MVIDKLQNSNYTYKNYTEILWLKNPAKFFTAFVIGVWTSLGFIYFNPIFLMAGFFSLLLLLRFSNSYWYTAKFGFYFGFGYFLPQLYWICLGPKIVGMWYIMPFALLGIPAACAFFTLAACIGYHPFRNHQLLAPFVFTLCWSVAEYLRGLIFPWNLVAYSWDLPILQSTYFLGIYGLSAWLMLFNVVLFSRNKLMILVVTIITALLWSWGWKRLQVPLQETNYNIRLVQPSISQNEKWSKDFLKRNMDFYFYLSNLPAEKPLHAVIWGESAVPYLMDEKTSAKLSSVVPKNGVLITGAIRMVNHHLYNSLVLINERGEIIDCYDKNYLVPFGEYVPFKLFPKITAGMIDYSSGNGLKTINTKNVIPPFSPLICYEIIFSGKIIAKTSIKPQWILNITNDAWFGETIGPKQHLKISQVRAIEEGMPIVRVANNGISAVIAPNGKILHHLNTNEVGIIDFALPMKK